MPRPRELGEASSGSDAFSADTTTGVQLSSLPIALRVRARDDFGGFSAPKAAPVGSDALTVHADETDAIGVGTDGRCD